MTQAKPGEFAHNYAAWSPLLCPACALRSKYNLGRLRASADNLHATSASPKRTLLSGSSGHAAFTETVAADIKLVAGKRDEKVTKYCPHKYGYNPGSVGCPLLYLPILSRHRPTGVASAVKTVE